MCAQHPLRKMEFLSIFLPKEFHLLLYFIEHRGATLSRDQILQDVWGYDAATLTRTVDMHVASLRQKLEKDPKRPVLILTVTGLGYRFAS
jgi:two-component system alkaline phosphatase synthesis response regulator PhoP